MISKPTADDAITVVDPRGVFGKNSLPGSENAVSEDAPLTAVSVTAHRQIHAEICNFGDVFGMMTEQ